MARTYDQTKAAINNPTNLDWAIYWFRFLANDKPSESVWPMDSLTDEEVTGILTLTSRTIKSTRYYLPHEALASKIQSDPDYFLSHSEESYSVSRVDPAKLVDGIRKMAQRNFGHIYPSEVAASLGFSSLRLTPAW